MSQKRKGFKEWFRKKVVSLKRNPQRIPLVMYLIAFLYYALNLTCISDTTAKIQSGMGICGFVTMLFSILSLVCFLNTFQHRKPVNKPMLVLLFVMTGIIIFADVRYRLILSSAVSDPVKPITVLECMTKAYSMLFTHIVLLCVSAGLVVLLPVYSKLLRKINTRVEIDSYDSMEAIDISGED